MAERRIPIAVPVLGDAELEALREPLADGWLTQGPRVARFERTFAGRIGVKHALATSNCTASLHLILLALGVGPGDEVIVPGFTWVATANVVEQVGATLVFADIDPRTYNLDAETVRRVCSTRTKAVIAVHLFGLCADVPAIAQATGVPVIEDAACAVGSWLGDRPAGSLGLAGAFSFHPRKIITTGEGGMVTTDDPKLAATVDSLRNHGASIPEEVRHLSQQPWRLPAFELAGLNYRMTDLQGAMGNVQLDRLDGLLAERRQRAAWYREQLGSIPWLTLPEEPRHGRHGWQAFVCRVDPAIAPLPRDQLMERLQAQGIATRPGTHAVPDLGFYRRRYPAAAAACGQSLAAETQTLAIPLHGRMSDEDYQHVVRCLHAC
ncbi:perosamine synthetase [Planctomycetota bacterium]|nr:perosamine synthetase [Planctomycetota bacterium]